MGYEEILNKALRFGEYTVERKCSHSTVVGMVQWLLMKPATSNLKVSNNDSTISFVWDKKYCVINFQTCL